MNVVDVTEATFERDVVERSRAVPVVIDFWASWCGPCRQLSPILERLAAEANGEWVLAKIDVDANPNVAAAFQVQGIPAVHAVKDGREIARFVGALPEQQVREWLEQLGPTRAELLVADASEAEGRGDARGALELYRRALAEEPGNAEARAAIARLELAERTGSADVDALRARAETDADAALSLADVEFAAGDVDAATERLIGLVRARTEASERARMRLLALLDTLAVDDPRALKARRELAAALF